MASLSSMRRPTVRASALCLALVALAGCQARPETARRTIEGFATAVQQRDLDRLYCLLAGAAESEELGAEPVARRAGFRRWAETGYEAYELGRDEGWVEPDEHGIALVKMFALGKGTYFQLGDVRSDGPDALRATMEIRFGYSALRLSRLSPGTTFYVCGVPLGRVHPIRVPIEGEVSVEALETVELEWTLVRRGSPAGGCAADWTVAAVRPVPDSWRTEEITWLF